MTPAVVFIRHMVFVVNQVQDALKQLMNCQGDRVNELRRSLRAGSASSYESSLLFVKRNSNGMSGQKVLNIFFCILFW